MQSVSPVFTEFEVQFEHKVAEHQNEYMTIVGLPVSMQFINRATGESTIVNPWGMSFRFRLTDEERAAVAAGFDLILTQLNFGKEVTPMNVQFCPEGARPFFGETPPVAINHARLNADGTIAISTPNEETITLIDPHQANEPSAADLDITEHEREIAEATGPQLVPSQAIADATGSPE